MKKLFSLALSILISIFWLSWCGLLYAADIEAILDDSAGGSAFSVKDSNSVERSHIDSNGNMVIKGGLRLDASGVENTTPESLIVDGNVGIGTTSPAYKLDVAGTFSADSVNVNDAYTLPATDGSANQVLYTNGSGIVGWTTVSTGTIGGGGSTNHVSKFIGASTLGDSLIYDDGTNVGIGTTSPSAKLDVNGQVKIGAYTLPSIDGTAGYVLKTNGSGSVSWQNDTGGTPGGSNGEVQYNNGGAFGGAAGLYYDNSSGNVGIGITNPSAYLHLKAGTATIAPLKLISGTNLTSAEVGAMEFDGTNLYFTPSASRKTIAFTDSNITGTASNVTGIVAVVNGGTGTLNGSITGSSALTFTAGGSNQSVRLTPSGSGYSIFDGNVGIGTTSPTQKLTVSGGKVYLSGTGSSTGVAFDDGTMFENSAGFIQVGHGTTADLVVNGSGDVGIGTTSPGAKLEVNGTVKITDGTQGTGKVLTSDANGLASWATPASGTIGGSGTTNYVSKFTPNGTTIGSSLVYDNGTNVGIGTTNPTQKLDIAGTVNATAFTGDGSGLTGIGGIISGLNTGYLSKAATPSSINDSGVFQSGTNIGIGTTNPITKLQVSNGSISVLSSGTGDAGRLLLENSNADTSLLLWSGFTSGASQSAIIYSSGLRFGTANAGDINATGWSEKMRLNNSGGLCLGSSYVSTDPGAGNLIISGSVGIGTTAPSQKLTVSGGKVYLSGTGSSTGVAFDDGTMFENSAGFIQVGHGTTADLVINGSGNVGIGTTNPGTKLEVNGTVKITDGTQGLNKVLTSDANGLASWATPASGTVTGSGTQNYVTKWNNAGGTQIGNSLLYDSGTNVGIGTTSPGQLLEIAGGTARGYIDSTTNDANVALLLSAKGASGTVRYGGLFFKGNETAANDFISLSGDNINYQLNVLYNGNVGIGMTSPTAVLHLKAGTTAASSAPLKFTAGTNLTTTEAGAVEYDGSHLYFTAANAGTRYQLDQQAGSQTPWTSAINAAGYTLNGNSTASGNLTLDSTSNATKGYVLLNPTGGNVGIGTTAPGQKLHIYQGNSVIESTTNVTTARNNGYYVWTDKAFGMELGYGQAGQSAGWGLNVFGRASDTTAVRFGKYVASSSLSTDFTELMTILTSGNVGIGTTNPVTKLHIVGTSQNTLAVDSPAYPEITLRTSGTVRSYDAIVTTAGGYFTGSAVNDRIMRSESGVMHFGGSGGGVPYMTLRSGNVGIGMTSPTAVLHLKAGIAAASNAPLKFTAGTNLTTTEAGAVEYDGSHLYFTAANAGTRYQLDQQGGSQTPWTSAINAAGYTLNGNSTASGNLTLDSTSNATKGYVLLNPTGGNVGIGTTGPVAKLEVSSAGGANSGIGLRVTAANNYIPIDFNTPSGLGGQFVLSGASFASGAFGGDELVLASELTSGTLHLASIGSSGIIKFTTGGNTTSNERMRITSAGNVGIGTTAPGFHLDIYANTNSAERMRITNISSGSSARTGMFFVGETSSNYAGFDHLSSTFNAGAGAESLMSNSVALYSGSTDSNGFSFIAQNGPLRVYTGGLASTNERMRIDTSGNVGIGTTSPKSALHVVGLPVYANNAAAIAGGLTAGAFYRTGADPDPVCVVH